MLTLLYSAMAAFAVWRTRHERQGLQIGLGLFAALWAAVLLHGTVGKPALAATLALVEALLAIWLLSRIVQWRDNLDGTWCRCSLRAMSIGLLCLVKIALWMVYTGAVQDLALWNWYAAAINGGFVLQAAIAGGFGDGLGSGIRALWFRVLRRRRGGVAGNGVY